MSHITHFYQLAALDYVQGPSAAPFIPYFDDSFYNPVLRVPDGRDRLFWGGTGAPEPLGNRGVPATGAVNAAGAGYTGLDGIWDNVIVDYLESLRWRRESLAVVAALAGRTPQTQSILAGGVTCRPTVAQCDAILQVLGNDGSGLIQFLKTHQIPLTQIVSYLYGSYGGLTAAWAQRKYDNNGTDIFSGWGAGARNFVSYGVFNEVNSHGDLNDPDRLLKRGYLYGAGGTGSPTVSNVFGNGTVRSYDGAGDAASGCNIVEFIYGSHYRLDASATVAGTSVESGSGYTASGIVPWNGYTDPEFEITKDIQSYSWIKSPRILHTGSTEADAIACQVGPLARMAVTGARGIGTGYAPVVDFGATATTLNSECESYKLGMYKSNVMHLHPTLWPIIIANVGDVATYFGAPPGYVTGGSTASGFLCGASTMDRHRARAYEALKIANRMVTWANDLRGLASAYNGTYPTTGASANYMPFTLPSNATPYRGRGMHEAPRGALSHWITVVNGKIENYQCVVPTTWNCSPRSGDATGNFRRRGPVEQAIMGDPGIASTQPTVAGVQSGGKDVPVEVLRIVHSFDPCIACAVH